jgi:hypothetical protein
MEGERLQRVAEFHLIRDESRIALERHIDVAGDFEWVEPGAGLLAVGGDVAATALMDAEYAGNENCDHLHGTEITVSSPRRLAAIHIRDTNLSNE